jgi:hypothetical protein
MVMMSPDSMPLKLMPTKDKNMPMVHAYLHPHMGVAITADQMPSMPSARTLQLWFVPKRGMPVSIAIFHPDAAGQIALVAPVNMPMTEIAALAVTGVRLICEFSASALLFSVLSVFSVLRDFTIYGVAQEFKSI